MPTNKINGAHLDQLDRNAKVQLYTSHEVDGEEVTFACCESGYGFCFVSERNKDNWVPAVFTVLQAQYRISQSFAPPERFWVEPVEETNPNANVQQAYPQGRWTPKKGN